ncbi:MAG: hypothetical protein ACHQ4H_15930 [Ktedonobacterales bacterium]
MPHHTPKRFHLLRSVPLLAAGLCLAGLLLSLSLGLAACGPASAAAAAGTPIPNGGDCGTVRAFPGVTSTRQATATAIESCFLQAKPSCKAASLTYMVTSVDVGTTHVFALSSYNGACTVSDAVHGFSANFGGSQSPTQTYTCAGVSAQHHGLLFQACGAEHDVFVPGYTPPPA